MIDSNHSQRESSCQAAVFHAVGQPLKLQTLAIPRPAAYEAIVRVDCCTLCGSDLHTITGARREPTPSILGHEILGSIDQVGDPPAVDHRGSQLRRGDRVSWSVCVSCGQCDRCQSGLTQKCRTLAKYGHQVCQGRAALSGGLAEFMLLRAGSSVVRLPESVADEVLCPVNCATATAAAACRAAGTIENRRVLVIGAGLLGLTVAALAKSFQPTAVVACDRDLSRVEMSRSFGADRAVTLAADRDQWREQLDLATGEHGYDVIVEASGSADAVELAVDAAAVGGKIVLLGSVMASRPVRIDPQQVVRRCLSISGVHNYTVEDLVSAVEFLQQYHRHYPFADVVAATYPLSRVNEAIEYAVAERPIRVAIRPHEHVR